MTCDILYEFTEDNVQLQGVHFETKSKDLCVICVHGMGGSFTENKFYSVLGNYLQKKNIGVLFGHNRGYTHINDLLVKRNGENTSKRFGAIYDIFEDCVYDIDLWVNTAKELGYKKLLLLGHSLGCNKSIYYLSQKSKELIKGVILASPPDMVGSGMYTDEHNYELLVKEAKENISNNQQRKILSEKIWEYYLLSSQTFLNFFTEGNPIDNLPLKRNPDTYDQLSKIHLPIFALMGEHDDITIYTEQEDLDLLKQKATSSPNVKTYILPDADHCYNNQEIALAESIYNWITEVIQE